MAVLRDRPYGNSNFLVHFGEEDSRALSAGIAEVIFPTFTLDPRDPADPVHAQHPDSNRLVLRRGLIGALNLYEWWSSVRQKDGPKLRTLKIELLSEDLSTVVVTWNFRNARPVSLSYSPLRALEGGIVMESIELAFESMDMS